MADYLDLYDYRQRVSASYRERNAALLAGEEGETIWQRFRKQRNELFVHHPQSALDAEQRSTFTGLRYFPFNPALCFPVEIEKSKELLRQTMAINAHETITLITVGYAHFTIEGTPATLAIYWLELYGGGLFLPFRDATCPEQCYGGGRYLFDTIKGSDFLSIHDGTEKQRIILDFNYAYNPSCAYNDAWTCPLAPVENRLPVPIHAGELKFRD